MQTNVDQYLIQGCGRCPLGGTPDCKVLKWVEALEYLRKIVLDCGLVEEVKWGVPCYSYQNTNVLIVSAFKDYCAISFFKGVLLQDDTGILQKPGPNSQSARMVKFTSAMEVLQQSSTIQDYIYEAIEVERAGLKVTFSKKPEPVPEEFQHFLDNDPNLEMAFESLTPGRQRGYLLYFSAPKQSKTKNARIEKCIPMIMEGIGLHDRY
jgi:uncharacterized protein YdeI (YjbR/CyaY-like superfamily)